MKRIVALVVLVLSGFSTFAFENSDSNDKNINLIQIEIKQGQTEKVVYFAFSDSEEMKNFEIDSYLNKLMPNQLGEDFCTAEMTVTVRIGFNSSWVEFKVTIKDVPCDEVVARAKAIAAELK